MNSFQVKQAYDSIAADYDALLEEDRYVRFALWKHYEHCFKPGQRILDVACGTGADSLFLAQKNIYVTAVDASPGMIAVLRQKLKDHSASGFVETHVLEIQALMDRSFPPFHGIVSAFAGLNTVPDLKHFAAVASDLLIPGGRMIVHMLNRSNWWKWVKCVGQFRWSEARNVLERREHVYRIGGHPLKHRLYTPDETYNQYFANHFILRSKYGLGIFHPPVPGELIPGTLDKIFGKYRPFYNWGRFFVLELQKRY